MASSRLACPYANLHPLHDKLSLENMQMTHSHTRLQDAELDCGGSRSPVVNSQSGNEAAALRETNTVGLWGGLLSSAVWLDYRVTLSLY